MKSKKLISLLLTMILSTSTLTGCSNVSTVTNLPLNNIQNVEESTEKEDSTASNEVIEETTNAEESEVKQETSKIKEVFKEETKKEVLAKQEVVTFKEVNEIVYAKSKVNVRKGPSTSYAVAGVLNYGKSVKRIGIGSNGWSKVILNGKECYINSSYLATAKPKVSTTTNNTTSNTNTNNTTSNTNTNNSTSTSTTSGYPMKYSDGTATITIYKEWYKNAYCYAAHITFSDYSRLSTASANGKYGNGTETTSHAASRLGAILTINGDYSSKNLDYITVRDGKICNGGDRASWLPAVYSQYTGKLLSSWESGGASGIAGKMVSELVSDGLFTDSFCFGPPILSGGSITAGSNTSRAQRTFIGTNGKAGDIWLVVSDGRYNDGKSAGLTYKEMASYLQSKGCTFGVPLDGGGSTTMVFKGKVLNAAKGNQRAVVDFVYFK